MYPLWTFSLNICCCFLINRIKYMNKSQIFYADIIFHDWVRIMDRRHLYSTLSLNRTVGKRNYQNNANVVTWSVISANREILMLSMLGRIYSRRQNKLFSYFSQKTEFDIPVKSCFVETMKIIFILSSVDSAQREVKVDCVNGQCIRENIKNNTFLTCALQVTKFCFRLHNTIM